MAKMMKTAERALHKRTNKMLASATKRYKKFMRQAAKAASDYKREEYLAAALSALVVTGVCQQADGEFRGQENPPQVLQGKNVRRRQNNRHARGDVDELRASRAVGAVQLAEATSSYSTSAVSCCAHSEQLNMSRSQPGVEFAKCRTAALLGRS